MLGLQSAGRGLKSRPPHCQPGTSCLHKCACHQAALIWHRHQLGRQPQVVCSTGYNTAVYPPVSSMAQDREMSTPSMLHWAHLYAFKPITGLHKLLHTNFVHRILLKPHLFFRKLANSEVFLSYRTLDKHLIFVVQCDQNHTTDAISYSLIISILC